MNGKLLFLNDARPDGRAVPVEKIGVANPQRSGPTADDSNASAIGGGGSGPTAPRDSGDLQALLISAVLIGLALAYALPGGWLTAIIAVTLAVVAPVPVMFGVTRRVHRLLLETIDADDAELILLRRARTQGAATIVAQAAEIARLTASLQSQALTLDLIESGGMCPGADPACCKLVAQAALLRGQTQGGDDAA